MQHSDQPFRALERARQSVDLMREAKTLIDVEEHWKDYLHRIERVWNKAVNHFGKSPKWNGWQGKYLKLRKADPLLSYLINARGADEHTISEITQREPAFLAINPGPSGNLHLRNVVFEKGTFTKFEVFGEAVVEARPAQVQLMPVRNRGIVYEIPKEHLAQPIDPQNLFDIAEKAIAFYADFLNSAEAFFVEPHAAS
jgi:hypothetical protein